MSLPRIPGDSTVGLATEGYRFGTRRFDRLGTDAFDTHLVLRPVTFMRGSSAARFFYEGGRFARNGAMPRSVLHLIQSEGSVLMLSGAEHSRRKAALLSLLAPENMPRLGEAFRTYFLEAVGRWAGRERVNLLEELQPVLTRTVCDWAGVPLPEDELAQRSRDFFTMVGNVAAVGPPDWATRALGRRTERWAEELVTGVRDGRIRTRTGSALEVIANLEDGAGTPLAPAVRAVELLNILRPTVAVGRYLVYCAWALHQHPAWRARFAAGDDSELDLFVHEVRRFFPFIPVTGGTATRDCSYGGKQFAAGAWVMLDLYATNHSGRIWSRPDEFLPQRFRGRTTPPNELVAQGGGYADDGHRCPGEDPTVELMREVVRLLTRTIDYEVPDQDLRISLRRVRAAPQSGFLMSGVRTRRPVRPGP
ncbi:cytochrome P450 [Lysobacter korlensis]|uniref:Cytochrome P450 n=1 Tax=Lysobacter korlensis TaxID=553636 RepID=A0ABV6RYL5_9GAMM